MAIKRMCPRCRKIIEYKDKYCKDCTARMNRDYDRYKRDKESQAFYESKEWRKLSKIIKANYHGLDVYQLMINKRFVPADTVHHIEEIKDNPSRKLDPSNLIPVSKGTHKAIHEAYKKDKAGTQKLLFKLIQEPIGGGNKVLDV